MSQSFTSFSDFRQRYPIRPADEETLLGSGTYGRVFKVEDQLETEWVAVKISEYKGNDTKSLRAEVELAQRVPRQANIARYDACYRLETDTGVSDFAIMKYYPDGNLATLLQQQTLTPAQVHDITRGILLGLQHLHSHRIVHRDFKPANILISRDNAGRFVPKIADFGLSKLVNADELDSSDFDLSDGRGTPSYKAPEQIEGSRVSFNLDLWAFGVILYELLTGEKPFRSDARNSSEQSVRREIEKKIVSVELPAKLSQIAEPYQTMIRRCLVHDIRQRVRRETELLDLLDGISDRLAEAQRQADIGCYEQAIAGYEQVIAKRGHHAEAEQKLAHCQSLLHQQRIDNLLEKASTYLGKQQYEEAQASYAQVLQLEPTHPVAARGMAECLEQFQPKLPPVTASVNEATDIYVESTDLFQGTVALPLNTDSGKTPPGRDKTPPAVEPLSVTGKASGNDTIKPEKSPVHTVEDQPDTRLPKRTSFRSRNRIIPVTAVLVSVGLYIAFAPKIFTPLPTDSAPRATSNTVAPQDTASAATTGPVVGPSSATQSVSDAETASARAAIVRRINVALDKARTAYQRNDFETALMLTNSALNLDPNRQDVVTLRNAAMAAVQKPAGPTPGASATSTAGAAAEPAKPVVSEPVVEKENPAAGKQTFQAEYEQLIDEGIRAIATTNNKTKAIADFNRANALAKAHDLNTAKADAPYANYLAKGNRIFDSDDYEMAKSWYSVAQALKNTSEVQRKIKQCTNQ